MVTTYWSKITLRLIIVIFFTSFILTFFYYTIPLLYPFIIGLLIALLIEPLVARLEKFLKLPRWFSVTIILFLSLSSLFFLLLFVIAKIVIELTHMAEFLPSFFENLSNFLTNFFIENKEINIIINTIQKYLAKSSSGSAQVSHNIHENVLLLAHKGTLIISKILASIGTFLSNIPFYLMVLVFITLTTLFIGIDMPNLKNQVKKLVPKRAQKTFYLISTDLKKALLGFIKAQVLLSLITATFMFLGLIILNIPNALTLAIITGFSDFIPYIGVGIITIPWLIYLLITKNNYLAIGLSIIYGIIILTRQLIEPKLVATNIGINSLLTLISLFIGLKLFGFLGLILGPIILVIFIALFKANVFKDIWYFITHEN